MSQKKKGAAGNPAREPRPTPTSAADRKLLREIDSIGWTLMYISEDVDAPNFAFTIGLFANYGQPEVVVVGLDAEGAGWLLTRIAEQVRDGRHFDDVHEFDNVLDNQYGCRFRQLSKRLRQENLGTATWFYQGAEFPALQVFVPDVNRKYPWEEGFQGNAAAQVLRGDTIRQRSMRS
jgi:hypothetical protein